MEIETLASLIKELGVLPFLILVLSYLLYKLFKAHEKKLEAICDRLYEINEKLAYIIGRLEFIVNNMKTSETKQNKEHENT